MRIVRAYLASVTLHAAALGAAAWIVAPAVNETRLRLERGRPSIVLQASIAAQTASSSESDRTAVALLPTRERRTPVDEREPLRPADVATSLRRRTSPVAERPAPAQPAEPTTSAVDAASANEPPAMARVVEVSPSAEPPQDLATLRIRAPNVSRPMPMVDAVAAVDSPSSDAATGTDVEQEPTPLPSNPLPAYPPTAYRRRIEGVVLLLVHVGANGRPLEVVVDQTSGSTDLDHEALRTVRDRWRFQPARRAGLAVDSWTRLPIRFRL